MGSISLKKVGKVYGAVSAVHDVDLEIRDGEFVVFVGPSGCGKSTLLRMIAGLESITTGEISINGKVMNDVSPRDRDIAMVFQSYALYPQMTVRENIAFALELRKFPKAEIDQRVGEAARILDLTELLDRKPRQLSGGQRQRVAMGRAIVRNPEAFLLDEPLSNLDAKLRVQLRAELSRLHARLGVTTIHVTHDQVEAMTLGSRVAVFSRGSLQQYDTPHALYHAPANIFVAGFIGSPAMNFLEAAVVEAGPGKMVVSVGGSQAYGDAEIGCARPERGRQTACRHPAGTSVVAPRGRRRGQRACRSRRARRTARTRILHRGRAGQSIGDHPHRGRLRHGRRRRSDRTGPRRRAPARAARQCRCRAAARNHA